jgi:RimJ/RimL family protein N-acetyltransferase
MAHALRRPLHLLRSISLLVQTRQFGELGRRLRDRVIDNTSLIGLRLDSQSIAGVPAGGSPVRVRQASRSDLTSLLDLQDPTLDRRERHDRTMRLQMMDAEVQTCFVAEDQAGNPCFVQWLVFADQNEKLQEVFAGWYPPLEEGEAMIEFAYTPPSRRGQGIMTAATSQILTMARGQGIRTVVTFIPTVNSQSIRIHLRIGFVPYLLHLERRRLGILRRSFLPIGSLKEVEQLVPGFDAHQCEVSPRKPNG